MADSVTLPLPTVGPPDEGGEVARARFVLNWGDSYAVSVYSFGLACCAVEFVAAALVDHEVVQMGLLPRADGPAHTELVVVSGTVTDKMAPLIARIHADLPEPKHVISFGSCANSGGPYWDSYSVTKGVDQIIDVDLYIPGCPPRPEALLEGIAQLRAGNVAAAPRSTASLLSGRLQAPEGVEAP